MTRLDQAPPLVLVLGMHRSGTSCLAGGLERCGLYLGDVRRTGHFNRKGYFEPAELVRLHDQILAHNRGSWHQPPPEVSLHPVLAEKLAVLIDNLTSSSEAHAACGIKDPRLLLLLKPWMELAGPRMRLVGTFRHPLAVAASLHRRNGLTMAQGLELWREYNSRLVEAHRRTPFRLIAYDLADPGAYRAALAKLARAVGLRPSRFGLWRFVSSRLDHEVAARNAQVPPACAALYDYLLHHAGPQESSA
ncbi:hypothetical protein [Novosphingobium sp. TH158]|uniref:hypothetical protein n=1 Tax=Novosphingobium sp. TH158 TaxID=2067455 RepID=UPI000C7D6734|nr:hypothetical protein [Novosphingobium sp. TH158]PLK26696.1 hypothetical protein C0V78_07205 [Novosphingobium sp. TH158]